MIRLQRCVVCGAVQYPPREICGACLSDDLGWESAASFAGRVIARTRLHHSNEQRFRARLPLSIGLVQFDFGPVALCFLSGAAAPGDVVRVRLGGDDLMEAA